MELGSEFFNVNDCQSNQKLVVHKQTDVEKYDEARKQPDTHLREFSDDCIHVQNPAQHSIHGKYSGVKDDEFDQNTERFVFELIQIPFDNRIIPQKYIEKGGFLVYAEN